MHRIFNLEKNSIKLLRKDKQELVGNTLYYKITTSRAFRLRHSEEELRRPMKKERIRGKGKDK